MKKIKEENLEEDKYQHLHHGREEVYLEYKGNVPWSNRKKSLK